MVHFYIDEEIMNITPEHWIFIPSIFFLGWLVGFLMGQAKQMAKETNREDNNA